MPASRRLSLWQRQQLRQRLVHVHERTQQAALDLKAELRQRHGHARRRVLAAFATELTRQSRLIMPTPI